MILLKLQLISYFWIDVECAASVWFTAHSVNRKETTGQWCTSAEWITLGLFYEGLYWAITTSSILLLTEMMAKCIQNMIKKMKVNFNWWITVSIWFFLSFRTQKLCKKKKRLSNSHLPGSPIYPCPARSVLVQGILAMVLERRDTVFCFAFPPNLTNV